MILGVDPGMEGGLAFFDYSEKMVAVYPMPTLGKTLAVHAIVGLLSTHKPGLIVMEKAEMRPGLGSHQVATTFENYGLLRGIFEGRFLPLEIVHPATWKKAMKVTQEKETSIALCQQLFPTVDLLPSERSRKPHDGMAEALLLAEWGRRNVVMNASEKAAAVTPGGEG